MGMGGGTGRKVDLFHARLHLLVLGLDVNSWT